MGKFSGPLLDDDDVDEGEVELPEGFREVLERRLKGEDSSSGGDETTAEAAGEGDGSSPLLSPSPVIEDEDEGDEEDSDNKIIVLHDPDPDDEGDVDAPEPEAAEPLPVITDDLDLNDLFTQWNGGTKPDRNQITDLLRFVQTVAGLPPEQQHALNALLSGEPFPPTQPSALEVTAPAPQNSLLPDDLPDETRALLEPIVANQRRLEEQLTAQETIRQQEALRIQQVNFETGIRAASDEFVTDYQGVLSTNDLILLETSAMQGGAFPQFLALNNNDPKAAYRALLEAAALSSPSMKEKILRAEASKSAPTKAETSRVRKASSVAPGGGPVTPAAKPPATKAERKAQALEMLKSWESWG